MSPRDLQRGVSLIEALVASALLGIGVVTGLTAWDTATMSAQRAVRQAWARCEVRSELDAILAAPWSDDLSGYPSPDTRLVEVSVEWAGSAQYPRATSGAGAEQRITVEALDSQSRQVLFRAQALKVRALQGSKSMFNTGTTQDVTFGCTAP
jgi:Tfp pilus assembly protein PilV